MPVETWIKLLAVDECKPGGARFVQACEHELAVFRLHDPDRFVVIRNSCPHAGGNLSAGEIEGGVVTCPWHQWSFDLDSGRCTFNENVTVRRYECRIEGGWLYARLDRERAVNRPTRAG